MPSQYKIKKKKAILTEVVFNRREGDHLAELSELAHVAGYEVVDRITQKLDAPTAPYLFGKGKAKEIKGRIKELEADVVIIENKIDAIQRKNLQAMWHAPIIDRFELILEIFINRAGTQEAITQIRLAALKKEGGARSESHRTVTSRHALIKKLEKKLDLIRKSKDVRRKRRLLSGFDLVAIAGYTNAGKSTLMNCLTSAGVEVSGRMFTTLDTTTRSLDALGRKILITDTVGLISRLPHALIEAFYATLKEINEADLILLLIDANDSIENIKKKVLASINTLTAIEAEQIPLLPVLNKIDIAQKVEEKAVVVETLTGKKAVCISAKKGLHLDLLVNRILEILKTYSFHLILPNTPEGMSLLSRIHDKTRLTKKTYHPRSIEIRFETNERIARYLFNIIKKSKLPIDFVNCEEIEKQLLKTKESQTGDNYSVFTTDEGEEFIVFDIIEDDMEKTNASEKEGATTLSKKWGSKTTMGEK